MKRFIFVVLVLTSCAGSRRISNQNLAYMYAPALNFIVPDYRICNIHPDTSRVFFSLDPAGLLFMNVSDSIGFQASVAFGFTVMHNYESKVPVDSGTFYFEYLQEDTPGARVSGHFDVLAPDSSDYIIQITLTDVNRQQAVSAFRTIDRTGIQPAQDFMVMEDVYNQPYLSDYADTAVRVRILYPNSSRDKIYLRYFKGRFPLSKPPFSESEVQPLSYRSDETRVIDLSVRETIELDREGIYHFQYDTLVKEGLTLFRFEEDFPKLTSAEGLIESIRFLTTREEYDKIINSRDKKQAVDDFWLSMAGNRERARVLIRNYYSRVQSANLFFTSYLEGWKTDRGLIYIIFGPPNTIYRNNDTETWSYSQNYNYGPLNFTFDKIRNPFTGNDYSLRRNNYYELPWYRAVDTWRDGRVVNDTN